MKADRPQARHRRGRTVSWLRGRTFTGLIIVLPIGATARLCLTAIQWVDSLVLAWVPFERQPAQVRSRLLDSERNLRVSGLGVVAFLVVTTIVGSLAKGLAGRTIVGVTEKRASSMALCAPGQAACAISGKRSPGTFWTAIRRGP